MVLLVLEVLLLALMLVVLAVWLVLLVICFSHVQLRWIIYKHTKHYLNKINESIRSNAVVQDENLSSGNIPTPVLPTTALQSIKITYSGSENTYFDYK